MTILPRDQVAERLSVSTRLLVRYERRGLLHATREGDVEGYEPSEIHRVWTVVSLQRDLGINLAGVEAVLKLRAHLDEVHARLVEATERLRNALETGDE